LKRNTERQTIARGINAGLSVNFSLSTSR